MNSCGLSFELASAAGNAGIENTPPRPWGAPAIQQTEPAVRSDSLVERRGFEPAVLFVLRLFRERSCCTRFQRG